MGKRIFTEEQIKMLLANKNIVRCTLKSVTYTKTFKKEAVRLYELGLTPTEIFRQAGLDLKTVGRNQPRECLRRWKNIVRTKGVKGLSEKRGKQKRKRKLKLDNLSDADKIRRLKLEVAYLKAENDFLAKLRAERAE